MSRIVVLVGMMGSGKTTIGRRVAAQLGMRFVDTDDLVAERAGKAVRKIFTEDGEPAFRALETQALVDALATSDDVVIAAAGGTILSEINRHHLHDGADLVVWLDADVTTLGERTSRGVHRPLLDGDPVGQLVSMDLQRRGLYEAVSDVRVDTAGQSIAQVCEQVIAAVTPEHAS